MSLDMRRSTARRSVKLSSPAPRSRSSERFQPEPHKVIGGYDDDGVMFEQERRSGHVRAISDPFDTQEELLNDTKNLVAVYALEEEQYHDQAIPTSSSRRHSSYAVLPTLPRFPVVETRNKNCWSEPPVSIFQVRGPNYAAAKKKITSGPYLLRARGCDIFLGDENSPELEDKARSVLGGHLGRAPTLVVNFRFPWGLMALYFEIPNQLVPYMVQPSDYLSKKNHNSKLSPSERLLASWLQGDSEFKNERLKLIPYVAEGPWVVRNMVTGRPAIIGKKLPVSHQLLHAQHSTLQPTLITTLDIGNSSATAKRIVGVCRRYMSALTVDIGFVVQGETDQELPEQMLGAIRVHAADPLQAPSLHA